MQRRIAAAASVALEVYRYARDRQVTTLAASIAYYALVSLLPVLLLALAAATAIGHEQVADAVVEATGSVLTPAGQQLLADALTNAAGRSTATALGTVLLAWSALKLFRGLDVAFDEVSDRDRPTTLGRQLLDAAIVLATVGVALVAVVALGGLVPALLARVPFGTSLSALAIVPSLTLVFLPMYVVFPTATVREALPGAALAAVGWAVLVVLFQVYAASAGQYQLYGVLGGVLLFVTWLYFGSIIIVLGAVTNTVLAGGSEDESEGGREPEDGDEVEGPAPDVVELRRELSEVQARLDEKVVSRSVLEGDLRAYVRRRVRRGHARGWGPYLVLLYGTAMTLGAFYYLDGGWAILAMVVVWLSTLGLYVLMVLVGVGLETLSVPGRAVEWVRSLRS